MRSFLLPVWLLLLLMVEETSCAMRMEKKLREMEAALSSSQSLQVAETKQVILNLLIHFKIQEEEID